MWWINYQIICAAGWLEDLQTINYKCFSCLYYDFVTAVKFLKLFCGMWEHVNYWKSGFQLFSYGESNYQIIFAFGGLEDFQTINYKWYSCLYYDFVTAVKLVGNKLLVCGSMWVTKREWFPTVLMWWIQLSSHICCWWIGISSNNKW